MFSSTPHNFLYQPPSFFALCTCTCIQPYNLSMQYFIHCSTLLVLLCNLSNSYFVLFNKQTQYLERGIANEFATCCITSCQFSFDFIINLVLSIYLWLNSSIIPLPLIWLSSNILRYLHLPFFTSLIISNYGSVISSIYIYISVISPVNGIMQITNSNGKILVPW